MCSFAGLANWIIQYRKCQNWWFHSVFSILNAKCMKCIQLARAEIFKSSLNIARGILWHKNGTLGDYQKRTFSAIDWTPDCWRSQGCLRVTFGCVSMVFDESPEFKKEGLADEATDTSDVPQSWEKPTIQLHGGLLIISHERTIFSL